MICWKDRTFCSSSNICANRECYRWIAPDQDTNGLPVCIGDMKTDDCGFIENPIYTQLKKAVGLVANSDEIAP